MRRAARVAAAVVACTLAACGQKGPLYLPDKKAAPVTPAPPAASPAASSGAAAPVTADTPRKNTQDSSDDTPQ
jgi:predicted small lipoprotein YifL